MSPRLYINHQRRLAVEVDENPQFKRMLRLSDRGVIDVVRMTSGELSNEGYSEMLEMHNGALRYALTFARSEIRKTEKAAEFLTQIIRDEAKALTLDSLNAELSRLLDRPIMMSKKTAAMKSLLLAGTVRSVEVKSGDTSTNRKEHQMLSDTTTGAVSANDDMKKAAKATKPAAKKDAKATKAPAKKDAKATKAPAKKDAKATKAPAKPAAKKDAKTTEAPKADKGPKDPLARAKAIAKMTNGSGGMIVQALLAGKTDADAIVSAVLKKFPDRKVSISQVAWYKSQLVKAGKLKG